MKARRYLPSAQFSLMAGSLLLSAGLVFAADHITRPAQNTIAVDTSAAAAASSNNDWQAQLSDVQDNSGISLPQAPDQTTVQGLLQAAKSGNITDTVSRSLLVNLMNAKAQGLGDDAPTQNQLVQAAIAQTQLTPTKNQYTQNDLVVVASSPDALHTYGNALATLIGKDGGGSDFGKTIVAIDNALSKNDTSGLTALTSVSNNYAALAKDLAALPVPNTLEPFHLELVNDFATIAALYPQIQQLTTDPVGGLSAVQQYNSLTSECTRVFTNIAQSFDKNAILFTKDEPGALWPFLLQQQAQTQ